MYMKTRFLLSTMMVMLITTVNGHAQAPASSPKILVVYYSLSGNTRAIAHQIKELTHADVFSIELVTPYPQTHNIVVEQAKKEIEVGYKPAIKGNVEDINSYDIIFIGSPVWWNTIAPPVTTFLSSHDFSGKRVIPFITHEGSRLGHTVEDIKELCPKATVLEGLPIRGKSVNNANEEVKSWLQRIKVIK